MRILLINVPHTAIGSRPKALFRTWLHPDRGLRHAMRWYSQMGRRVWPHEILSFRRPLVKNGPTVAEFWGAPQDEEEESMAAAGPERRPLPRRVA